MLKFKFKANRFNLLKVLIAALFSTLIIYSCKKDFTPASAPLDDHAQTAAVQEAKAWFDTNSKINEQPTKATNAVSSRRWSDGLNPDWGKPLVYSKDKNVVVEMPLANSAVLFAINRTSGNGITQKDNYTKTSFIVQKDSAGVYRGWLMVLVADTAYVNGDFSKLKRNNYQKHDPAFSGRLMYFDLQGSFLAGWKYDKGLIKKTISLSDYTSSSSQINSTRTKVNLVQTCYSVPITKITWECITVDFNNSGPQTTCTPHYDLITETQCTVTEGGGGGGGGGSGGTNPGDTFPPPPKPDCPPVAVASVDGKHVNLTPGGGGGSGGGTTPCDPVPPEDPCAQANKLAKNSAFKSKMTDLKSKTSLPNEVGYTVDSQGNYSYVQGAAGAAGIGLNPVLPLSGYIHTHYTGLFPTFSGSDIKAVYDLQQAGKISDISSFTAGVVTASGTTYILKINDPAKFSAFGAANFNSTANFNLFEQYYNNNKSVYSIAGNDNVTSYELALLEVLKDSGVTLLKGDSNFSSWNTLTKTSGNAMTDKVNSNNCK